MAKTGNTEIAIYTTCGQVNLPILELPIACCSFHSARIYKKRKISSHASISTLTAFISFTCPNKTFTISQMVSTDQRQLYDIKKSRDCQEKSCIPQTTCISSGHIGTFISFNFNRYQQYWQAEKMKPVFEQRLPLRFTNRRETYMMIA